MNMVDVIRRIGFLFKIQCGKVKEHNLILASVLPGSYLS